MKNNKVIALIMKTLDGDVLVSRARILKHGKRQAAGKVWYRLIYVAAVVSLWTASDTSPICNP